ncbi:MAG: asparagine synthase (glutamine-hydrolyzing) [Zoogloea sp.]|nr:asparagine synthase (glutamine-hydrolyzing) [Zoogloea sp.]
MCGFAGFWNRASVADGGSWPDVLDKMGVAIRHRGPDDAGVWVDAAAGVGLVHRRLSILDLSPAGHQPMVSQCGRYVVAFNGEIYNHLALREEIGTDTSWRGHSDTETLLAGIVRWGLAETLKRSVGMFALALWDRQERTLRLARDRMGEKPLYFGWQGGVFLFGSELKALRAHPAFAANVDRRALCLLLRQNCIPAPYSIYEGVGKLSPASVLTLREGKTDWTIEPYWTLFDAVLAGQARPFEGDDADAISALDSCLRRSVAEQMVADVPLGAFLSGGVDSSTVVALMQAQAQRPVKTFSIGFREAGYDEAQYASAVARHLATEHTEFYVSPEQAMAVIPGLPALYDEPFSDSSQIPTFLVSQMARRHVAVALSGDAGDELFGGYSRYLKAGRAWRTFSWLPGVIRKGAGRSIKSLSPASWNALSRPLSPLLPVRMRNLGEKVHKMADLFGHENVPMFYRRFTAHWHDPAEVVRGGLEPSTYFSNAASHPPTASCYEAMMAADTLTYLPDDILVKVDRAAMGVSLETRIPMLDHRIVEFAWSLPLSLKIREGQGKWILRQVLRKYVPDELMDRPKMGFGVPLDSWLRGPLRDWAEALLDEARVEKEGFLNPKAIRVKWHEHLSGQRNWQYLLWDVLMFQAWLEAQKP